MSLLNRSEAEMKLFLKYDNASSRTKRTKLMLKDSNKVLL